MLFWLVAMSSVIWRINILRIIYVWLFWLHDKLSTILLFFFSEKKTLIIYQQSSLRFIFSQVHYYRVNVLRKFFFISLQIILFISSRCLLTFIKSWYIYRHISYHKTSWTSTERQRQIYTTFFEWNGNCQMLLGEQNNDSVINKEKNSMQIIWPKINLIVYEWVYKRKWQNRIFVYFCWHIKRIQIALHNVQSKLNFKHFPIFKLKISINNNLNLFLPQIALFVLACIFALINAAPVAKPDLGKL